MRFVNVNVAAFDAAKHSGVALVADARVRSSSSPTALDGLVGRPRPTEPAAASWPPSWDQTVERAYTLGHGPLPAQSEVIGVVNDVSEPRDVVVCAAGSMPGDLHKLWRTRDPKGYHVEYGFSCMGYEIAGGLGVKMAAPDREVFVMVGDGSYLMMAQEIVTAVQEGIKLVVVLVQNHGYRLDRQPVRVARLATLRHALSLSHRRRRGGGRLDGDRSSDRPRRQRREPRRRRAARRTRSRSCAKALLPRHVPRTAPPSSTSRPTRWSRLRTARAGGTSPSPKYRRSRAPRPRVRPMTTAKRSQRTYL